MIVIRKQTAYDIYVAYDEIEKGEKLAEKVQKAIKEGETLDLRDHFGRPRPLKLGVPSGENAHQLFDVAPSLALQIIKAHVANKRAELATINERAKVEAVEAK